MKHYVILDCEDSETWDPERYYTMHKPIMGKEHAEEAWSLLHIARGDKVPALSDPPQYDGIVITGSRHNVRDELPWMGPLCALIQDVSRNEKNANVRLYGGCFGAQIIAHALGGEVDRNPGGGFCFGTERIRKVEDSVEEVWVLHECHGDCVTKLPPGGNLIGSSDSCVHEVYRVGKNVLAIQSHPECMTEFVHTTLYLCAGPKFIEGSDRSRTG